MAEEQEPRLMAYADRWSASPGQRVSLHASGAPGAATVDLVDLVQETVLSPALPVSVEPRPLDAGSHLEVTALPAPSRGSIALWIRPRHLATRQVVAELSTKGWRLLLVLDEEGRAEVTVGTLSGRVRGRMPSVVQRASWSLLVAAWEATPEMTTVHLTTGGGGSPDGGVAGVSAHAVGLPLPSATGALRLGAGTDHGDPFLGRFALPMLTRNLLTTVGCVPLLGLTRGTGLIEHVGGDVVALWDASHDPGAPLVPDISGNGHHAHAVNRPLMGLIGPGSDAGRPADRTAVQPSPEDLDDARWPETCALTVPEDTTSTVLGIRLRTRSQSFVVPLIVRPADPPRGPASRPDRGDPAHLHLPGVRQPPPVE